MFQMPSTLAEETKSKLSSLLTRGLVVLAAAPNCVEDGARDSFSLLVRLMNLSDCSLRMELYHVPMKLEYCCGLRSFTGCGWRQLLLFIFPAEVLIFRRNYGWKVNTRRTIRVATTNCESALSAFLPRVEFDMFGRISARMCP